MCVCVCVCVRAHMCMYMCGVAMRQAQKLYVQKILAKALLLFLLRIIPLKSVIPVS